MFCGLAVNRSQASGQQLPIRAIRGILMKVLKNTCHLPSAFWSLVRLFTALSGPAQSARKQEPNGYVREGRSLVSLVQ